MEQVKHIDGIKYVHSGTLIATNGIRVNNYTPVLTDEQREERMVEIAKCLVDIARDRRLKLTKKEV